MGPATFSVPDTSFDVRVAAASGRAARRRVSTFDRLPIRTRLAGVSALLTFTILCAFAIVVGSLTVHRIRTNFDREVAVAGDNLAGLLQVEVTGSYIEGFKLKIVNPPNLNKFASSEDAAVRILSDAGNVLASTSGAPSALGLSTEANVAGYRVHTRPVALGGPVGGSVIVQYGRRLSDLDATIARVELLLLLGVMAGTALALLGGHDDRQARDGPDRRADEHRQRRSRARATPAAACPSPWPTTRSLSSRARSGACCASSTPPTPRPRRRSPASASSWPTPRTSCARRSRACSPTWSCSPSPCTARRPTRRARPCAPPSGCVVWWPTCCCWRAPTWAESCAASRATSARSWSKRPPSWARSAPSTRSRWTFDLRPSRLRATSCTGWRST